MTETMPAFGADRNAAIARLLGWLISKTELCRGMAPDCPIITRVPNYCDDDGACFRLLVTLQKLPVVREIALRYIDETVCVKISTDLLNYSDGWTYDACEQSTLPGECGWRDAITQAAWEALTAAKETA